MDQPPSTHHFSPQPRTLHKRPPRSINQDNNPISQDTKLISLCNPNIFYISCDTDTSDSHDRDYSTHDHITHNNKPIYHHVSNHHSQRIRNNKHTGPRHLHDQLHNPDPKLNLYRHKLSFLNTPFLYITALAHITSLHYNIQ